MPLVSVIIASHNRSAFLPRAVESAQAASTNVEVIVVDDASPTRRQTSAAAFRAFDIFVSNVTSGPRGRETSVSLTVTVIT